MVYLKTKEEIELLRESNNINAKVLGLISKHIAPGITGIELDTIAETYIRDSGGVPSFKGYGGFPSTLCISVNDVVVHGIPSNIPFEDGDIVSVDCGVYKNGYHGDSAYTFCVGNVDSAIKDLLETTKRALYLGIEQAVEGKRLGDISYAIQSECEKYGYGVVREMVGHGIGRSLHEDPQVPNYGRRGTGIKLIEGLVIAIEPMVNMKDRRLTFDNDGWTTRTVDHLPSAHFEHSIAICNGKADILSSFEYIEN